jgi:DNA primase large subunit
MQTDEIVAVYRASSVDEEAVRYQTEYLRDESGSQYAPPSCETMRAYGDCVNRDARCETISHPMAYYGRALVDADRAPDGDDANAD